MLGNEETDSPPEKKHDGYDNVRVAISEKYPEIGPEDAVEVLRVINFLVSTGERSKTTYKEIMVETGLSRTIIEHIVKALESLGYLAVDRKKSGKFILVNGKRFYGEQIREEIERYLKELITTTNEYAAVRGSVGNLPEEAMYYFDNGNLGNAIKIYNEAVKKLEKAKIRVLPQIEWRNRAFKISLSRRFYYDYEWR